MAFSCRSAQLPASRGEHNNVLVQKRQHTRRHNEALRSNTHSTSSERTAFSGFIGNVGRCTPVSESAPFWLHQLSALLVWCCPIAATAICVAYSYGVYFSGFISEKNRRMFFAVYFFWGNRCFPASFTAQTLKAVTIGEIYL